MLNCRLMIEVTIRKYPASGVERDAATLARLTITNDATGDELIGHYDAAISLYDPAHVDQRRFHEFRATRVENFPRSLGPEALVSYALDSLGYQVSPRIIRELSPDVRELKGSS